MLIGRTLRNRYSIKSKLGSGGFGDTYLAEDRDLPGNPLCVVKHLKPKDPNVLPLARRLFKTEAKVLYKLGKKSDRIPKLFAYFEEGGEFYFVQEYISGQDLSKELVPGRQWREPEVVQLLQGILEVLQVAHRKNVIHRDIKPANLMRRADGKIVLIDFGAVKEITTCIAHTWGQTTVSVVIGTPGYMPREQAKGKPRLCSDVYAVGMIGIQALTGIGPVCLPEDPQTGEVVWRNRAQVSSELGNILDKMARAHFSRRYQHATKALQALNSLTSPPPDTVTRRAWLQLAAFGGVGYMAAVMSNDFWNQQPQRIVESPSSPSPTPKAILAIPALFRYKFTTVTVNAKGKIVNRQQGRSQVLREEIDIGVILEMVAIPGGTFLMGSPKTEAQRGSDESPQHRVTVQPFFLGKYPVTQAQWQAVMGNNPSNFLGNNRPVEDVSWDDCVAFCQKLSQLTGRNYRLPSEAEWEYACRAGTATPFHFGETITTDLANYDGDYTYASAPKGAYRQQTTDVGSFPPNAFGVHDMHGNVWEWCQDVYHDSYNGAPSDGSAWESWGDSNNRMQRGGSWGYWPRGCRCAVRYWNSQGDRYSNLGLRVALG